MRVLQIVQSLASLGGLERYVERLSRRLTSAGHATTVFELGWPSASADVVLAEAERWQADVVLTHQAGDAELFATVAVRMPLAVFVHTTLCPGGKLFRRGDRVCKHALGWRCMVDWYTGPCGNTSSPRRALTQISAARRKAGSMLRAHAVIVASDWMRRHALEEGAAPDRVHLCDIREGLDPPRPARAAVDPSRPRLLFVGRVVYGKGAQYAVEALQNLAPGATLRVVGDGWFLPELKALARRLGVSNRVHFDGAVDEAAVEAAYEAADVLVVPSVWPEPAGLVVPEGRARGLPVVVFDRGGLAEWRTTYGLDGVHVADQPTGAGLAKAVDAALATPATPAAPVTDETFEPILDVLHRARQRFEERSDRT